MILTSLCRYYSISSVKHILRKKFSSKVDSNLLIKNFYSLPIKTYSFFSKNLPFKTCLIRIQCFSSSKPNFVFKQNHLEQKSYTKKRSTLYYVAAVGILVFGLSYASVPLYRIFCQAYSYGGTTKTTDASTDIESMVKRNDREISVRFNADTSAAMTWNFRPQQKELKLKPGETALAFYSAYNPTDKPVIGVSTYNVIPFDAGQYFNKIQCFCFEEQMLNPNEEVSMPVFFYIDPEFAEDPLMENISDITLSYTFFEVKEGHNIPIPKFERK